MIKNDEKTIINLFSSDVKGIGNLKIITDDTEEEAIKIWSKKAHEVFSSNFASIADKEFYYEFTEKYMKNKFYTGIEEFMDFKKAYLNYLFEVIENDSNIDYRIMNIEPNKYSDYASYKIKNHSLTRYEAIKEFISILANDPSFNPYQIKLEFKKDGFKDKDEYVYNKKTNTLFVDDTKLSQKVSNYNHSFKFGEDILPLIFDVLNEVQKQNKIEEMNTEITLNALFYNLEKNFKRAFKNKAFNHFIDTPAIEHDSQKATYNYFRRTLLNEYDLPKRDYINNFLKNKTTKLSNEYHYNPNKFKYYNDQYNSNKNMLIKNFTTRSLLSIRANPKSLSTNIKRSLFIDGELKTVYKLEKEIEELKNTKKIINPSAYLQLLQEKTNILNYLIKFSIPSEIEYYASLYSTTTNEALKEIYRKGLLETIKRHPTEFSTSKSILKNRLEKLNSYSASSAQAYDYFEEIIYTQKVLNTLNDIEKNYVKELETTIIKLKDTRVQLNTEYVKVKYLPSDPENVDRLKEINKLTDEIVTKINNLNKKIEWVKSEHQKNPECVNITYINSDKKYNANIIHELQKLSGKGIKEIMDSIESSNEILLLHNVPSELAKTYTNNKVLKEHVKLK